MATDVAPAKAALWVLVGMATLGFSDNLIVHLTDDSSLWQFHLMRSLMVLAMLGLVAASGFGGLRPRRWTAVAGRSAILGVALLIYFGCLAIMPIGVVVAGFFTAPLFVALISSIYQRKPLAGRQWVAVALGFCGAVLVIRPDPQAIDWVSFLPVLAGLCYAVGAVATRAWCEGEGTMTLSAGFFLALGLFGVIGCIVLPGTGSGPDGFSARGWMPLTSDMLLWLAVLAVGAMIGIFCIFRGYQVGEASHVAVFEYSLLIFASGWAWYLWGQTIPPLGFLGMALIILSGVIVTLRRRA
ncbi:DMT family transporter [Yoonia litorea]|uniref:EamA-like transporter family protein n=1 Tax=Yoonia litorea TaxID=1123755 RepID=A0A1I6MJ13_9RHOB|nr:DMT family transporter [Yoonia litorea]SFS15611.1 EamA-like transporter family protein [Yoonia litorea]